jgi:DNA-directed RNA polymerase specialized sigma24 family protein
MKDEQGRLTEPIPPHRVLREALRHYTEYKALVTMNGSNHVIKHGYRVYPEEGDPYKVQISISFWDLHRGIKDLSPRKRQALFYNVILDWKQKDVAKKMNITTVSVGQYVEQAVIQLADKYFEEDRTPIEDGNTATLV